MSDEDHLRAWAQSMAKMTHYQTLGIERTATVDEVKRAFSIFAESFHPDGHRGRPPKEQDLITRIFMRGTEAYRVLAHSDRRFQYDTKVFGPPPGLAATGGAAGAPAAHAGPPVHIADRVRVSAAKPFVMKALQLMEAGQHGKAKLDLSMAMNMDRDNPHLKELMDQIERAVKK